MFEFHLCLLLVFEWVSLVFECVSLVFELGIFGVRLGIFSVRTRIFSVRTCIFIVRTRIFSVRMRVFGRSNGYLLTFERVSFGYCRMVDSILACLGPPHPTSIYKLRDFLEKKSKK